MEIVKDEELVMPQPEFDPNKKYKWTPDTQFVLNGADFAGMLNTMRSLISTEQAQNIIAAHQASLVLEELLKGAVEDGRAIEIQ